MKADVVFYNGEVVAMDGVGPGRARPPRSAVGVRGGRIVFPREGSGWKGLAGPSTEAVDLKGSTVIPGLVDCHLHPLWGARSLSGHSLDYRPMDVEATLGRLREFLELDAWHAGEVKEPADEPLLVRNWARHGGADVTADDLGRLDTARPVLLFAGDGHTVAMNRRALRLFRGFVEGPPPADGRVLLDAGGKGPSGLVEDGPAMRLYDFASRETLRRAAAALSRGFLALNSQGVTAVMDARATADAMEAADLLWHQDGLTVRVSGAWEVTAGGCPSPARAEDAAEEALAAMKGFRRGPEGPDPVHGDAAEAHVRPGVALRHMKLFVDGMPGHATARLRDPYLAVRASDGRTAPPPPAGGRAGGRRGAGRRKAWDGRGLAYFDGPTLAALFLAAAGRGLHPHCHVIADGALDLVLDAAAALRAGLPASGARPAAAHLDLAAPDQYGRMRELGVAAVLSFQWAGYEPGDLEEAAAMFGPERLQGSETHARFIDAGVVTAYGSDWPVEAMDEWRNFQIGATRRLPGAGPDGRPFPRLDNDRDLGVAEILHAATRASAWVLGAEGVSGCLAEGRPADLAVVEGPLLSRDPGALKDVRVTRTLVGGRTVWQAD